MDKYDVAWDTELGKGTFGTVYGGIALGVVKAAVAIKLCGQGNLSDQAIHADAEVRRYLALPRHPHIVKLLDVVLLRPPRLKRAIGLVFERFDIDVRQFLKRSQLGGRDAARLAMCARGFGPHARARIGACGPQALQHLAARRGCC